ncbi:hypothetical protein J6590_064205, partial [Homalodisca vitripennis]
MPPERKHWVHPINEKRDVKSLISELQSFPEKFYNYCRMSVKRFEELLDIVQDHITKKDTNCRKSITAEERLFITL